MRYLIFLLVPNRESKIRVQGVEFALPSEVCVTIFLLVPLFRVAELSGLVDPPNLRPRRLQFRQSGCVLVAVVLEIGVEMKLNVLYY